MRLNDQVEGANSLICIARLRARTVVAGPEAGPGPAIGRPITDGDGDRDLTRAGMFKLDSESDGRRANIYHDVIIIQGRFRVRVPARGLRSLEDSGSESEASSRSSNLLLSSRDGHVLGKRNSSLLSISGRRW